MQGPTRAPGHMRTCGVVERQAVVEHVSWTHAVGVVAEGCNAVVPV